MKQMLKDEIISIYYVKSKVNLADPLTKPLGKKINFGNIEWNET